MNAIQENQGRHDYAARRGRLAARMTEGAVAVVPGRVHTGAFDLFRQNNEFHYLCGVEVPQAYLTIMATTGETVLYLPHRDEKMERSEGVSLNCDRAEHVSAVTGIPAVRSYSDMAGDLANIHVIYAPLQEGEGKQMCRDTLAHGRHTRELDPWDRGETREQRFLNQLKDNGGVREVNDLVPLLDEMRGCKEESELHLMRVAGRVTAEAVCQAMRSTRVGGWEYELAAVAEYVFLVNGATGGGYRPIIAGGHNIWNAHYYRNNCVLRDGDLVLMDYAPDYQCYTSDIGRMWPVNGRYADWQRELYGYIVEYHKTLLTLIRPGVMAQQVEDEAAAIMQAEIESRDWSRESFRQGAMGTLGFRGHLSHGVGMAVHDVWDYRQEPLKPGVVLALDPQMWIQEDELYIRVEDTVVVTEDGVENLTAAAPLELDEVESLLQEPGMVQQYPPVV